MERFVTDTHTLIWHLEKDPRLGENARSKLKLTETGETVIYRSVITLIEVDNLIFRNKINERVMSVIEELLQIEFSALKLIDLNYPLHQIIKKIPREAIPEMPDRIITASALHLGCPLLTKDSKITAWGGVETIW